MCDGKSQWCQMFVKWYPGKKQYRMYCKAHGFKDQEYLTWKEVDYFRQHHPEMISKDGGPLDGEFSPEQWNTHGQISHWIQGRRTRG